MLDLSKQHTILYREEEMVRGRCQVKKKKTGASETKRDGKSSFAAGRKKWLQKRVEVIF